MAGYTGTSGNNSRSGTIFRDKFKYFQGGNDKLKGRGSKDVFQLGAEFTALDRINGGNSSRDRLELSGDYSAGVALGSVTLREVERIKLGSGFDYSLTTTTIRSRPAHC
jgi:hypothetical protein